MQTSNIRGAPSSQRAEHLLHALQLEQATAPCQTPRPFPTAMDGPFPADPGFAPASSVASALTATAAQAVRVVAIDVCAPPDARRAAARLIRAVFSSAAELTAGRDYVVILAVGGDAADPSPIEILSTLSQGSLADPRFEKTCIARLAQASADAARRRGGNPSGQAAAHHTAAHELVQRLLRYVGGRFGAARLHLYIGSHVGHMDSLDAFAASGAGSSVQVLQPDRDPWSLFGEALACLLTSRVTLKIGDTILQLVARPRVLGVGCLPAVLSLTAVRRAGIDSIPEDVLFGIPTALVPDPDVAEDAASTTDSREFATLAAALYEREEALVAVERAGPHLVVMPVSRNLLMLREVASKENLLPAPHFRATDFSSPLPTAVPGHVFGIADTVALSPFTPLSVSQPTCGQGPVGARMVGFAA